MPGHISSGLPAGPPAESEMGPVGRFIQDNFKHFNAATLREASDAYIDLLDRGGKMFPAMAGAMSTGELGISLAEMIRQGKVHAICCTGANLEEDLFNLSRIRSISVCRHIATSLRRMRENCWDIGSCRVLPTCASRKRKP